MIFWTTTATRATTGSTLLRLLPLLRMSTLDTGTAASSSAAAASSTTAASTSAWNDNKANTESPNYDNFAQAYADQVNRCTMLHATDLIGMAAPHIRHAHRILELGCGAGAFALAYLQQFPGGMDGQSIVCTDLSPAMVDVARAVTEKTLASSTTTPCQTTFTFQVADATKLTDFDDDDFDMVISVFGIFLIPDRASTLSEVRRVLKKDGGHLLTSSWTSTSMDEQLKDNGFGAHLQESATRMKVFPAGTAQQDRTVQALPPFLLDWYDRDKIGEMLRDEHRFSSIAIRRAIHSTAFANVEHLWQTFTKSSPHFATHANQDAQQVTYAKQALGEFVAHENGKVDEPIFILSVSNLIVAS